MAELVHTTAELVHSLCCAITACKELNQVLILLQLAVDKLLDFKLDDVNYSELEDADEIVDNIHRLAEITNVSAKDIHTVLFYSSFQELAEVLLSGTHSSSLYVYAITSASSPALSSTAL